MIDWKDASTSLPENARRVLILKSNGIFVAGTYAVMHLPFTRQRGGRTTYRQWHAEGRSVGEVTHWADVNLPESVLDSLIELQTNTQYSVNWSTLDDQIRSSMNGIS